jgi:hypothetical protein
VQRPVESGLAVRLSQLPTSVRKPSSGLPMARRKSDIARTYAVHPATIRRTLGTAGSPFADASGAAA